MKTKRSEHLYRQLDYYYDDFSSCLSTHDPFIIQNKLAPLLQTISSIAEMQYSSSDYHNAPKEDKGYLYGLVRANNLIKHNELVIEIVNEDTVPKISFPFSGSFVMGLVIIAWKDIDYSPDKKDESYHRKKQIESYESLLSGKEVSLALNKGIDFLRELQ